jgi:hypothetical protein
MVVDVCAFSLRVGKTLGSQSLDDKGATSTIIDLLSRRA